MERIVDRELIFEFDWLDAVTNYSLFKQVEILAVYFTQGNVYGPNRL